MSVVAHGYTRHDEGVVASSPVLVGKTAYVYKGRMEELLEFLKEDRKRGDYNCRLYQSDLGTFDQISIKMEYEDMAAYEKFWAEWNAQPDTPACFEKWLKMTIAGGTNEIWRLVE